MDHVNHKSGIACRPSKQLRCLHYRRHCSNLIHRSICVVVVVQRSSMVVVQWGWRGSRPVHWAGARHPGGSCLLASVFTDASINWPPIRRWTSTWMHWTQQHPHTTRTAVEAANATSKEVTQPAWHFVHPRGCWDYPQKCCWPIRRKGASHCRPEPVYLFWWAPPTPSLYPLWCWQISKDYYRKVINPKYPLQVDFEVFHYPWTSFVECQIVELVLSQVSFYRRNAGKAGCCVINRLESFPSHLISSMKSMQRV